MKLKLKEYVDGLFVDAEGRAPGNPRLIELKEEMLLDLSEKYDDLVASGRSPENAYRLAVSGIGDIGELLDAVIGKAVETDVVADVTPATEIAEIAENVETTAVNETAEAVETAVETEKAEANEMVDTAEKSKEASSEETQSEKVQEIDLAETHPVKDSEVPGAQKPAKPTAPDRPRRSRWCALVCGIIWTLVLGIYLTVSYLTGAWGVTWLIILMGVAADNVTKGIFDLRR